MIFPGVFGFFRRLIFLHFHFLLFFIFMLRFAFKVRLLAFFFPRWPRSKLRRCLLLLPPTSFTSISFSLLLLKFSFLVFFLIYPIFSPFLPLHFQSPKQPRILIAFYLNFCYFISIFILVFIFPIFLFFIIIIFLRLLSLQIFQSQNRLVKLKIWTVFLRFF